MSKDVGAEGTSFSDDLLGGGGDIARDRDSSGAAGDLDVVSA